MYEIVYSVLYAQYFIIFFLFRLGKILQQIIHSPNDEKVLIFAQTKVMCERISQEIRRNGYVFFFDTSTSLYFMLQTIQWYQI